jgi:POT family proton-dependent oligopeptide transporter
MVVSLIIFIIGRRYYPDEKTGQRMPAKTIEEKEEEKAVLRRLAGVFGLLAVFWFVYDQNASTWIFFARSDMNLTLWPLGFTLTPDQLQGINPLLIIGLTPIFNWMWGKLEKIRGDEIFPTHKMMLGFILVFLCMVWMSLAGYLSGNGKVSVWFIVIATIIMSMAELCVSVIGLRFAFTEASPRMKSTIMAAFLLSQFLGDGIGAGIDRLYDILSHGSNFGLQAVIIGLNTVAFYFVARNYQSRKKSLETRP